MLQSLDELRSLRLRIREPIQDLQQRGQHRNEAIGKDVARRILGDYPVSAKEVKVKLHPVRALI
jgi:hypothetical protein